MLMCKISAYVMKSLLQNEKYNRIYIKRIGAFKLPIICWYLAGAYFFDDKFNNFVATYPFHIDKYQTYR